MLGVYVVVQFYPWFKFSFLLFQTHYHVIIIHYHTQKQKKRKFEPRIKLNHNIYSCTSNHVKEYPDVKNSSAVLVLNLFIVLTTGS